MMYSTQPADTTRPPFHIRIDLGSFLLLERCEVVSLPDEFFILVECFRTLRLASVELAEIREPDGPAVFQRLLQQDAFEFCAQMRFGVAVGDNLGRESKYVVVLLGCITHKCADCFRACSKIIDVTLPVSLMAADTVACDVFFNPICFSTLYLSF
jgi:hypothetical protein